MTITELGPTCKVAIEGLVKLYELKYMFYLLSTVSVDVAESLPREFLARHSYSPSSFLAKFFTTKILLFSVVLISYFDEDSKRLVLKLQEMLEVGFPETVQLIFAVFRYSIIWEFGETITVGASKNKNANQYYLKCAGNISMLVKDISFFQLQH